MDEAKVMVETIIRQFVFGGTLLMMAAVLWIATEASVTQANAERGWFSAIRRPLMTCPLQARAAAISPLNSSRKQ